MPKRVTLLEVAKLAGVSYQTVSRVINRHPSVAPATRERVLNAIKQLDYQPNAMARGLASQRTRILGLITSDFSDYFFTQVIIGAEVEARKHGYFLMLASTERNVADEPEYLRLLNEWQVDGILFARPSTEQDSRHIVSILRQGMPMVTTAYHLADESLTIVDIDNVDGARKATRCLVEAGHQRIGMITGPPGWRSVEDRTKGYRSALEEAGLQYDRSLLATGDWSYQSGYAAMQQLLQRSAPITALFAQNDAMAIGALRALREVGRRVPDDVAVVGYDDIPAAAYACPPLTTIRQPMREVGAVAARLLIEATNQTKRERKEVWLQTELVLRMSSGVAETTAPNSV